MPTENDPYVFVRKKEGFLKTLNFMLNSLLLILLTALCRCFTGADPVTDPTTLGPVAKVLES